MPLFFRPGRAVFAARWGLPLRPDRACLCFMSGPVNPPAARSVPSGRYRTSGQKRFPGRFPAGKHQGGCPFQRFMGVFPACRFECCVPVGRAQHRPRRKSRTVQPLSAGEPRPKREPRMGQNAPRWHWGASPLSAGKSRLKRNEKRFSAACRRHELTPRRRQEEYT